MIVKITSVCLALGLASFTLVAQVRMESKPGTLALTHVTVIDATGRSAMPDMTVIIIGDRITQIGRSAEVTLPKSAQVVNGAGKYLIPGLWDAHVWIIENGTDFPRLVSCYVK